MSETALELSGERRLRDGTGALGGDPPGWRRRGGVLARPERAGKTTLLKTVMGVVRAETGTVRPGP